MVWLLFRSPDQHKWSFRHNAATVSEFHCLVGSDASRRSQVTALHTRVSWTRQACNSPDDQVLVVIPIHGTTHPDQIQLLLDPTPTPAASADVVNAATASTDLQASTDNTNDNFHCEVLQRCRACFPDTLRAKHTHKLRADNSFSSSSSSSSSSDDDDDDDGRSKRTNRHARAARVALRDRVNASLLLKPVGRHAVHSVDTLLAMSGAHTSAHTVKDNEDDASLCLDELACMHLRASGAQVAIVARYQLCASQSSQPSGSPVSGCIGLSWLAPLLSSRILGSVHCEDDSGSTTADQSKVLCVPISRHAQGHGGGGGACGSSTASLDGVDEDVLVAFERADLRIYSINTQRLEGVGGAGKTPSEMLDDMRRRHASGTFVEIVPPLTSLARGFRFQHTTINTTTAANSSSSSSSAEEEEPTQFVQRFEASALAGAFGLIRHADRKSSTSSTSSASSPSRSRKQPEHKDSRTLRLRRQVGAYPVDADMFLTLMSDD